MTPGNAPITALGLMSGTSLDGIDAALLTTDGEVVTGFGPALTIAYDAGLSERVRALAGRDRGTGSEVEPGAMVEVGRELTLAHAVAVDALLERARLAPSGIDVIGFHGHTILHEPTAGRTLQIGDGALLAQRTGIDVVDDFRSADVAAGGEGAPLSPLYHAALSAGLDRPIAVLNLGGVANVTFIGADGKPLAFDSGPGNALVDDWAREHTGRRMDEDGALARSGWADRTHLETLLADPYFCRPPPKSLDRDHFAARARAVLADGGLAAGDGAALLTAFSAEAVKAALAHLPEAPLRWLVAGGGRRNPVLMSALRTALDTEVKPVEAVGWDGDALEAQCFAYLAVRSRRGLALSLPETTGVARPVVGGRFHPAGTNVT